MNYVTVLRIVFDPHAIYTFINSKDDVYAPVKLYTILQRKGLAWRAVAHNRSGSVSFQQIIFGQLIVFTKYLQVCNTENVFCRYFSTC